MSDEHGAQNGGESVATDGDGAHGAGARRAELTKKERKRVAELEARFSELVAEYAGIVESLDGVYGELEELGCEPDAELAAPRASDVQGLERQAVAAEEQYRRVLADFSNFQRRARENEARAKDAGRAQVLESMVDVLDTFDLAGRMDPKTMSAEAAVQGIGMIKSEMLRKLGAHGFRSIEPARGQEFDPHAHEATGHEEAGDVEAGCVVRVMKPGYELGGRVLRAAGVTVRPGSGGGGGVDEGAGGGGGAQQNDTETLENSSDDGVSGSESSGGVAG